MSAPFHNAFADGGWWIEGVAFVVEAKYQMSTVLSIVALVLEALLGAFTAYAAYGMFTGAPMIAKIREKLQYPNWFWLLANIVAPIGAVGLFVGLGIPSVGAAAALWMVCYFIVASGAHLVRKDMANLGPPLVFLALSVALVALRWGEAASLRALVGL